VNMAKQWPVVLMIWVGVIFILFFFVLTPRLEVMESLSEERERLERDAIALRRKIQDLEPLQQKLASLQEIALLMERRLPKEKEIPGLLITIEDAGFLSNVEIQSLVPKEPKPEENFTEVPFSSKLRNTFHDFLLYLNYLRRAQRLIQVQNFEMKKNVKGEFEVSMNLATYILEEGGGVR